MKDENLKKQELISKLNLEFDEVKELFSVVTLKSFEMENIRGGISPKGIIDVCPNACPNACPELNFFFCGSNACGGGGGGGSNRCSGGVMGPAPSNCMCGGGGGVGPTPFT